MTAPTEAIELQPVGNATIQSYAHNDTEDGAGTSPTSTRRSSMVLLQNEQNQMQELPPVDRGRGAWLFVAAAFLLETFVWGWSFSFATVLVYLQKNEPWSQYPLATLSAIGSVQLGLQYIAPLGIIVVFRRFPDYIKPSLWVSLILNCGAMLLSSWSTKVWHLIVLQGVVCGLSGAILYTPVLLWLSDWFLARRGLAGGLIWSGSGVGGFLLPFLISALLSRFGFHGMIRIWVGITAAIFTIAVYFVKPRIPPPRKIRKGERGPWPLFPYFVLKDSIFLSMAVASLLASLSTFPVSLYLATYASSLTSTPLVASIIVAVFNLAGALGCFGLGTLSDFSYTLCTVLCGLAGAISALLSWSFADSIAKTYGFAILFGFFSQMVVTWSGATRDVAGRDSYAASLTFGLLSAIRGVASIFMPLVSASLYDPTRKEAKDDFGRYGFSRLIIFVGATAFGSALAGLAVEVARRKKKIS